MKFPDNLQKLKRVSVIIPSHDRPRLLREAIESVFMQNYPEWEIIVIDDGSMPPIDLTDRGRPGNAPSRDGRFGG